MPDWTYQTVFRPVLRRLPYRISQALVFGVLGRLGKYAAGRTVIRTMGHASPHPDLRIVRGGFELSSPCGLGTGVDEDCQATAALSQFGVGLIELGPVDLGANNLGNTSAAAHGTRWTSDGVIIDRENSSVSALELVRQLKTSGVQGDVHVFVRIICQNNNCADNLAQMATQLSGLVSGFVLDGSSKNRDREFDTTAFRSRLDEEFSLIAAVGPSLQPRDDWPTGFDGYLVECGSTEEGVEFLERIEPNAAELLIIRAEVHQPIDGLRLIDRGADVVLIDEGVPLAGPGLPKRVNNCVLASRNKRINACDSDVVIAPPRESWFWGFLLGISLTVGGVLALCIGWTRVVLPYDEEYLGMLRDEICSINPQLLPFMSHDRVTLAGTMLALGPLYLGLTWFADRRGMHWARVAWISSAFVGFFSFFSFLGFGYFDPFHAFISVVLFQLTLFGLRSPQSSYAAVEFDAENSASWKRALWGQLLFVVHGIVLTVAGSVIIGFGVTNVFVAQDLEFMNTTRELLLASNPRLVPLVAHDRASFGGMLLSTGIAVTLTAMWGWQRGRRWLWSLLAYSGTAAYGITIAVHWAVGYTSLLHLLPAYGGLMMLWISLGLSWQWMFEDAELLPPR